MRKDDRQPPKIVRPSKYPTLAGGLGFLNVAKCPRCGKRVIAYYDKDLEPNNGWRLSEDVNYCVKCGQHLDLDKYKKLDEIRGSSEEITFENEEEGNG